MSGHGGSGTNPEQLFAVGYAACFQSALLGVAQGRKLDAGDALIKSRVGIGPTGHSGFGLQVALDLHAPHQSPADAADLMIRADQRCRPRPTTSSCRKPIAGLAAIRSA
ncbi:hypothetical protein E0H73_42265 [Kribbella pittospori]|uniref:Ohr family peroxiredoxin n=1 Tax=Kribbella pittospori TaxID=722689 RepID=A0A4R0JWH7_9ACTN|nr:hypothetical protein E0H73_42265 [Kribbella pittospori]